MQHIRNVLSSLFRAFLPCSVCVALALHGTFIPAASADPAPGNIHSSLCDTSRSALSHASTIRGLAVRSEVPCIAQDKPAVESFLHETIKTELPPLKIQMEELAFKAVGLLPDDFDYGKQLVSFLVSQIGGYYDPKKKRFVMASWLPPSVQLGVAIHELTHALQDQHYNLQTLLNRKMGTTDSDLAISALIEGDASAVMFDHQSRSSSGQELRSLPSVDSLLLFQVLGLNFGAHGSEVPDALKGLLIFPYTSGLRFSHALLRKGGYPELDRAYSRLPITSRQILHPEEFIADSFKPSIPEVSDLPGYTSTRSPEYTDTLGEFGISSILSGAENSKKNAADAARGWIGDRLGIFPQTEQKQTISWVTRWQSSKDADEFFATYKAFLESRYQVPFIANDVRLTPHKFLRISKQPTSIAFEFTIVR